MIIRIEKYIGKIGEWLEQVYLKYQLDEGRRVTLGEFAEKLGISQGLLSHYLKGIRKPRLSNIIKMIMHSGILSRQLFVIMGYIDPDDKWLGMITANWHLLSEKEQEKFAEQIEAVAEKNAENLESNSGEKNE